jgi:L-alanine-DL-glutamate epimerase-like enolase superfamily enzyme
MKIRQIDATRVYIPYEAPVGPYEGRSGPTHGASALIVRVETEDGRVGWGEGHGAALPDATALLRGQHVGDVERVLAIMSEAGMGPGPRSGVEMALWDLLGKAAGVPVCRLLGGIVRDRIEFCACMGLKVPEDAAETAAIYVRRWGFQTIKTKAGRDPEEDYRIAQALRNAVGPEVTLRPDANSGYTPEQAEPLLRRYESLGIQYFEDPCSSEHLEAMARFRREIGVCIANNMGVSDPASALRIVSSGAADVLMPDTTSAGGMLPVKQVAAVAAAAGLPCLMHCSHDLGLKTAAVAHIAASTPAFGGANDTCYHGLTDDILVEPLRFRNGCLSVPLAPGLGVEVDEAKLARYRVR